MYCRFLAEDKILNQRESLFSKTNTASTLRVQIITLMIKMLKYPLRRCHTRRFETTILSQHSDAMLEQCWKHSKQCRNNVGSQCCAKSRRCESSPVTSPKQTKDILRIPYSFVLKSIFESLLIIIKEYFSQLKLRG